MHASIEGTRLRALWSRERYRFRPACQMGRAPPGKHPSQDHRLMAAPSTELLRDLRPHGVEHLHRVRALRLIVRRGDANELSVAQVIRARREHGHAFPANALVG